MITLNVDNSIIDQIFMAFRNIDKDSSNNIDYEEFEQLLIILHCKFADHDNKALFDDLDTDHNGVISFAEFLCFAAEALSK